MLSAMTRRERKDATSFVFDTVNALGGWIDDVQMYSNIMNNIRVTLPAGAYPKLFELLNEAGIHIEQPREMTDTLDPASEQMATLQITFIHEEPDPRREVPAVPGY
ncbi:MAG: hypothetical protein DI528_05700 [Shinella sp.]|nr:MAG: hypothetical protein DI528_05700 [Shinella sp.]